MSSKILFVSRQWGASAGFNLELLKSAQEFYGRELITYHILENSVSILDHLREQFSRENYKYLLLDTRCLIVDASFPSLIQHIIDTRKIYELCIKEKTVPICFITDPLMPGYALMGDLLTYRKGICVPITAPITFSRFLKRNSTLPLGTPISLSTSQELKNMVAITPKKHDVLLGGSLYAPRRLFFEKVTKELLQSGVNVFLQKKSSNSYLDYLSDLVESRIVISTSFVYSTKFIGQIGQRYQMLGKSFEALYSGALLMTQSTSDFRRYFVEYKHYIPISDVNDTVQQSLRYLQDEESRSIIAQNGFNRAHELANERFFFSQIERAVQGLARVSNVSFQNGC